MIFRVEKDPRIAGRIIEQDEFADRSGSIGIPFSPPSQSLLAMMTLDDAWNWYCHGETQLDLLRPDRQEALERPAMGRARSAGMKS